MTTFGPQQGPPPVPCVLCGYAVPHEHPYGVVPLLPCRHCWIGLHDQCDPVTYFCVCLAPECTTKENRMTDDPVDDATYTDDVADDNAVSEDLGTPADPAQVPPDEGDAGADGATQ